MPGAERLLRFAGGWSAAEAAWVPAAAPVDLALRRPIAYMLSTCQRGSSRHTQGKHRLCSSLMQDQLARLPAVDQHKPCTAHYTHGINRQVKCHAARSATLLCML